MSNYFNLENIQIRQYYFVDSNLFIIYMLQIDLCFNTKFVISLNYWHIQYKFCVHNSTALLF